MNNLLSYCGLVDVRINASDKDSPVAEKAIVIFHFLADFCNSLSSRHEKH